MSKEKQTNSIKDKLHLICEKIEQVLKECNETGEQERYLRQIEDVYNINSGSKINTIKSLKGNVTLIQNNLEKIYDINKINKIESEIKKKISTINQLSEEQRVLLKLMKNQQESIDDYSSKFTINKEIMEVRNKLNYAKEENKMKRETCKILESKIRGQLSKIDVLDKKSKIIRQNIEYEQKKQKKEVEKSIKLGENGNEEEGENAEEDLESLIVAEKMFILEINDEERQFKNEINKQKEYISILNDKINEINNKRNEIKQKIIEDEKKKKINKIKNKENSRTNKKNKTTKVNPNNKSNDYQKNIYKTNKLIYRIEDSPKNKNETKIMNTGTKSKAKPFDIKKFGLVNNDNNVYSIMKKINSINSINNPSNEKKIYTSLYLEDDKKSTALKEIEQLQNEIKYALKNNVAVLHSETGDVQGNENNLNNDKKIQNFDTNNKKSKPFGKINFN